MSEEEKVQETNKHCYQCKKMLPIIDFIMNNKNYCKCNDCRKMINSKREKQLCKVCAIPATFNYKREEKGIYCKEHMQIGMINLKYKTLICIEENCIKRGSYNYKTEKQGIYCVEHKKLDMFNVYSKKCLEDNCNKEPIFNYKGEKEILYCKEHSKDGMINVKDKKCLENMCQKRPNFNYKGEILGIYCKDHQKEGMIDVVSKKCLEKDCDKQPSLNYKGEKEALYCKEHSKDGMINVISKRCSEDNCDKHPTFNYKGEKEALYCKEHKKLNMIDVKHKKCLEDNCDKRANFNYKSEKEVLYCKEHSKNNMINIKDKKCLEQDCDKRPYFNYKGENSALYCKDHSKDGMININDKNKKCLEENCDIRAGFGFCGQQPTKCAKHKLDKMFVRPKRTCEDDDCKEIALYGITEPKHCLEHSDADEFCLVGQKCKGCNRQDELLNKEKLCINYCVPNEIHKKVQREKLKEVTVLKFLDKFINHQKIIEVKDDKIVNTFCNYYRPDRIYDCGTHCVVVEVDEFQHKGNRSSCAKGEIGELARMHEIQNAVGLHCIFLRFNPDNFYIKEKLQKVNMNIRLKSLVKWIEYCIEMKPNKDLLPVKYKYLFYDDYEEGDLKFKEINDMEILKKQ